MSKFKIGDIVTVRSDLEVGEEYGDNCTVYQMKCTFGKRFEIAYVTRRGQYLLEGANGYFEYTNEMLEDTAFTSFEIGDTVYYKKDLVHGYRYGSLQFLSEMQKELNKVHIITEVSDIGNYKLDNGRWYVSHDMLEKAIIRNEVSYEKYDYVTIKNLDGIDCVGKVLITDSMKEMKGLRCKILEIKELSNTRYLIKSQDGDIWRFTKEMFEESYIRESELETPVVIKEGNCGVITYNIYGDETIAMTGWNQLGKAKKSKGDKVDKKVGILIATARALGFTEDQVQGFTDVIFGEAKTLEEHVMDLSKKDFMEIIECRFR